MSKDHKFVGSELDKINATFNAKLPRAQIVLIAADIHLADGSSPYERCIAHIVGTTKGQRFLIVWDPGLSVCVDNDSLLQISDRRAQAIRNIVERGLVWPLERE